jgi:hypothetical protein
MKATQKSKPASKRSRKGDDELKVFRALQRVPAEMSKDQVFEIDQRFMSQPYGVARRLGLPVYTLSGKDLTAKIKTDRALAVAHAEIADRIDESVKVTRQLADDLERAAWRIRVALCAREDTEDVIAEARKPTTRGKEGANV